MPGHLFHDSCKVAAVLGGGLFPIDSPLRCRVLFGVHAAGFAQHLDQPSLLELVVAAVLVPLQDTRLNHEGGSLLGSLPSTCKIQERNAYIGQNQPEGLVKVIAVSLQVVFQKAPHQQLFLGRGSTGGGLEVIAQRLEAEFTGPNHACGARQLSIGYSHSQMHTSERQICPLSCKSSWIPSSRKLRRADTML